MRRTRLPMWILPLAMIVIALAIMTVASGHTAVVSTFPIPGARVAAPQTQITFRGIPAGDLGKIVVSGSRSGQHLGRVAADSDGRGGSFLPARPFAAGEVVTVRTGLRIRGARRGTFRFTVAHPAGPISMMPGLTAPRTANDVLHFQSRPDLTPAAVQVSTTAARAGSADIFLGPQNGPLQDGPMIVDPHGNLVWFKPVPPGDQATDFRVQALHGRPVLTWWQGHEGSGVGFGEDVIADSSYRQLHVVRAGNGLSSDLHEFDVTPQGTALVTAYYPVYWDASAAHGSTRQVVLDAVVQEIDIDTGLVLFQWDSLDHVPITQSQQASPDKDHPFDYFHVNSIQQEADGSLLVSARNTWAAYDIDRHTGRVIWTLGGKGSSFKMGSGTQFAFQHDVRVRSGGAMILTAFDDGAGPPTVHAQSRAITLRVDRRHRTVKLVREDAHSPALLANYEGNTQLLKDGDDFVGWGQQPYFTEFDRSGRVVLDGHFVDGNSSYRVFRFPWRGTPSTPPTMSVSVSGPSSTVYASWNGATNVASWRVLGGTSAGALRSIGGARRQGFETAIPVPNEPYLAVQALAADGHVLGTSRVTRTGAGSSAGA